METLLSELVAELDPPSAVAGRGENPSRQLRDGLHVWLRQTGVAEEQVTRAERIRTTLILGYAIGEASGRLSGHSPSEVEDDYIFIAAIVEQMSDSLRSEGSISRDVSRRVYTSGGDRG